MNVIQRFLRVTFNVNARVQWKNLKQEFLNRFSHNQYRIGRLHLVKRVYSRDVATFSTKYWSVENRRIENSDTHVIVESFGFRRMFTSFPPFGGRTVQIPKYAINKINNMFVLIFMRSWTYHHQECRNPGGSPKVMFFSHRI